MAVPARPVAPPDGPGAVVPAPGAPAHAVDEPVETTRPTSTIPAAANASTTTTTIAITGAAVGARRETPRASVWGYIDLLRQGAVPPSGAGAALRRIQEETRRMSALVDDLLHLAHLDEQPPRGGSATRRPRSCSPRRRSGRWQTERRCG
ncbi:histidine kinase dimerization/phospho-acceptor domain-containing protein [Frankia sp. AvcI1]|uniref:histidine kinase dimerization/phospho-acceptor domain-containing protein n=1 Tax=Frankia sp. AvcI1 TaxID=573496 RepID=UPI0035B2FC41